MTLRSFILGPISCALTLFAATTRAEEIRLSDQCPPSLKKGEDGRCFYRGLYAFEDLARNGFWQPLQLSVDGLSPQLIDLGRYLFFDPILSKDRQVSCASCHLPDRGLADPRPASLGIHGRIGQRNAPPLWNVGFYRQFFWDGRATTLEEQAAGPLLSADEMGQTKEGLERALNESAAYRRLFATAYMRAETRPVTFFELVTALATFQRSLISLDSRFDRFVAGDHQALSPEEHNGFRIFRSFRSRCSECHMPPLFTNQEFAVIGAPDRKGEDTDLGVGKLRQDRSWHGGFRVPSLRNIAHTAPYMHSGALSSLEEVVEFYDKGEGRSEGPNRRYTHWHIRRIGLSQKERLDLQSFLLSLSDLTASPKVPEQLPSGLPREVTHASTQSAH